MDLTSLMKQLPVQKGMQWWTIKIAFQESFSYEGLCVRKYFSMYLWPAPPEFNYLKYKYEELWRQRLKTRFQSLCSSDLSHWQGDRDESCWEELSMGYNRHSGRSHPMYPLFPHRPSSKRNRIITMLLLYSGSSAHLFSKEHLNNILHFIYLAIFETNTKSIFGISEIHQDNIWKMMHAVIKLLWTTFSESCCKLA